jgi:DNA-binding HxlR family transcriptional regulator
MAILPAIDAADHKARRADFRRALGAITGRWKLEILWLLNQHKHRFGELRRALPGITQHMLTTQLRDLEMDGLVERTVFAEVPPRVEYEITSAAEQMRPIFQAIFEWAAENPPPYRKVRGKTAERRQKPER